MTQQYRFILYSVTDRIARITLNAPERRNALSFPMRDEIVRALRTAEADDEVSVVLIDGAGPSFCSGYDMSAGNRDNPKDGWVHSKHFDSWTDPFARSCLRDWLTIWDLLKPVVVKAHGHCVAGGTEILSMADIAFVAEDARIGYPPMRGMTTPDTLYFPWKMSMARAKYLQLTLMTPLIFSDRPQNLREQRLLLQHATEAFHQRAQASLWHVGDQVVEHAALTE